MTNVEQIIKKFEELRTERWEVVNELLNSADDADVLLADVANLITMIYLARQAAKTPVGFRSFRKNSE